MKPRPLQPPSSVSDSPAPPADAAFGSGASSAARRSHPLPNAVRRRGPSAAARSQQPSASSFSSPSPSAASLKAVFTSSLIPFFAPSSESASPPVDESASASSPSPSSAAFHSPPAVDEDGRGSSSSFPAPSLTPSYARLPESIVMRVEESEDAGSGEDRPAGAPSLKAITKRSREALRLKQQQIKERGEAARRAVEAKHAQATHSRPPSLGGGALPDVQELDEEPASSRQPQRTGEEGQAAEATALPPSSSSDVAAAVLSSPYRPSSRARAGSRPSPALGARTLGSVALQSHASQPQPQHQRSVSFADAAATTQPAPSQPAAAARSSGRVQSVAASDDEFDEEDEEDDGGDGLDDEDSNSDANYADDAVDDHQLYIDPPSPHSAHGPHSSSPSAFSFHPAPSSQSSLASDDDSAPPMSPSSSSQLSMELVSAVLNAALAPPSLIRLSTPSPFSPRTDSSLFLGSPADSSLSASLAPPLLYPAMPETSRLHSLLMGHGLSVPHVQQLLALLLLYSVAFHDIVQAVRSGLDQAEGGAMGDAERLVVRLWRLFLFAVERVDGWTEEERPTLPDMAMAVAERERRQMRERMAAMRAERMRRLKEREERASERVLHYHRQLLTLSADRVRAEEERRGLDAEVEAERGKQRQRNEERAKRKEAYEEQQRRAKVARERRRMMMEDRLAMDRDMPRVQQLKQELSAQLSSRRRDNNSTGIDLRRATERLAVNEANKADLERRAREASAELQRALQEEAESRQRLDEEQAERSPLYDRLLYEVEKRVKVMGELKGWIDATRDNEEAAASLLAQVEEAEERRQEVQAEMSEMREGQRDMEANIAAETVRQAELQRSLQLRGEEVKTEELRLRALRSELSLVQTVRAERLAELESILAVVKGEERRLADSEQRLSMTHHHIEQINADSVAFDRHNYARMKEAKQLDQAKAAMEVERAERRRAIARFEEEKKAKLRFRETRNSLKEKEVLEWMKRVRAAAEEVQSSEDREVRLSKEADSNSQLFDVLLTDIEESREERRRLEKDVERAKEESEELREKREKVKAIQLNEVAVLQSLHVTHASQQEVKLKELEALDAEGAAVAEEVMGVRRELADVAVQRSAVEAEHQRVMMAMQEELSDVVKEGVRHDEEMKAWMVQQREERERMNAEMDLWKAKAQESQREQAKLRAAVSHEQQHLQQEKTAQSNTRMEQQIATQNNNSATYQATTHHTSSSSHPSHSNSDQQLTLPSAPSSAPLVCAFSTVLRHLNSALNDALVEYYTRFQQQQPYRQTLLYAELVNAELQSAVEGHEACKLQAEGRWQVRHANTQTQPIHFARA